MNTVLQTRQLRREFGELRAVDDVDLEIRDGEITSVIGPNGAGKTTFYNLLTGTLSPTSGEVRLRVDGELVDVTGLEPHEVAAKGLSRSYQITNLFERLTVRENLTVAGISDAGRSREFFKRAGADPEINRAVDDVLALTNLEGIADEAVGTLSHGEKRTVEIALALATNPSVVLLDEPTAGMNPSGTDEIVELVRGLDEDTDTTFVLTEHDMDVVLGISDRIVVLDRGRVIADGDPEVVLTDENVTEAYLGGDAS